MNFFSTDEQIMYANVPAQNSLTIYSQVGDVFAWLCIAGFIAMIIPVLFKKQFVGLDQLLKTENQKMKTSLERG